MNLCGLKILMVMLFNSQTVEWFFLGGVIEEIDTTS